jgi:hypothetical protein
MALNHIMINEWTCANITGGKQAYVNSNAVAERPCRKVIPSVI